MVDVPLAFSEYQLPSVAVTLARLLHAGAPAATPTFSDRADIPAWAVPLVCHVMIWAASTGEIGVGKCLTHGDAAEISARVAALR